MRDISLIMCYNKLMEVKTCCFVGHRKIEITDELEQRVCNYIENLIVNENVKIFLFGSRSDFDWLCHAIVDELKTKYTDIKLVAYNCRSEASFLESEREKWEEIYSHKEKRPVHLLCVDEVFDHKTKYKSGRAAYVERNYAMIDNSDYCLFYYDENYLPPKRKWAKRDLFAYQPKSGTALAYKYAQQKKKIVHNFY